jgi:hypothetical protein
VVAGNNTKQISRKLWQEVCIKTGTAAIYQTTVTSQHHLSDGCGTHVLHTCQHLELRNWSRLSLLPWQRDFTRGQGIPAKRLKSDVFGFRGRAFEAILFLGRGVVSFRDLCLTFRHSVVVSSPTVECLHCTFGHWYFDTWICDSGADRNSGLPRYGTDSSCR